MNRILTEVIVIDNGSSTLKAGFAGSESTKFVFTSIVGQIQNPSKKKKQSKDLYIADEAIKNSEMLHLEYPIEHGVVTNWDNMEKIWHYTIHKLQIEPSECSVIITEHAKNPKANRAKMIEIMFEKFNMSSFFVSCDSTLSMYSSGDITGIVCDIGDGVSEICPFYHGYSFPHAINRRNFGGGDLTKYLSEILTECGYKFTTTAEMETLREIKEKNCYVALNYDEELQKLNKNNDFDVSYKIPNGKVVKFSDQQIRCPEILFKPQLNGFQLNGIDKAIFDSIMKCPIHARKELYGNIILSGGCTMLKGFKNRIEKEIASLAPPTININVKVQRKDAVWYGGSVLGSLIRFPMMVIEHDEYDDAGPGIVHRKCFF